MTSRPFYPYNENPRTWKDRFCIETRRWIISWMLEWAYMMLHIYNRSCVGKVEGAANNEWIVYFVLLCTKRSQNISFVGGVNAAWHSPGIIIIQTLLKSNQNCYSAPELIQIINSEHTVFDMVWRINFESTYWPTSKHSSERVTTEWNMHDVNWDVMFGHWIKGDMPDFLPI